MKYSQFDDIDEWDLEDKAQYSKQNKKAKSDVRVRRRIDEYNEKKQLDNYIADFVDFS
ncbi:MULTISPECIES: PA3496 family putative envelope integrity protein [unclassified Agarivorans]|uniref:PA3496 family putative envelope integrity protein n=1 Tax=unclassified Agarivorans TaxID=2636026 RepID=UPI003D7D99E1